MSEYNSFVLTQHIYTYTCSWQQSWHAACVLLHTVLLLSMLVLLLHDCCPPPPPPHLCVFIFFFFWTGVKVESMSVSSTTTHSVCIWHLAITFHCMILTGHTLTILDSLPLPCVLLQDTVFQQSQWQLTTLFQLCCWRGRRMSGQ